MTYTKSLHQFVCTQDQATGTLKARVAALEQELGEAQGGPVAARVAVLEEEYGLA